MATGFTAPLLHSGGGTSKAYEYRIRTGMVSSAEWTVFMDDFVTTFIPTTAITNGPVANTPSNWQGAIIDTGATVAVNTTAAIGANGVLTLADATASEGAAFYGQKTIQLTAGKKLWMEARIRTDDVTDNNIYFGLSSLTATTNPEDLYNTASDTLVAFGIADGGSGFTSMVADKSNAGPTTDTATVNALTADTWHILAIYYDGTNMYGYVNGQKVIGPFSSTAKIPTAVAMAPFVSHVNGDGAGGAVVVVDYVRIVSER